MLKGESRTRALVIGAVVLVVGVAALVSFWVDALEDGVMEHSALGAVKLASVRGVVRAVCGSLAYLSLIGIGAAILWFMRPSRVVPDRPPAPVRLTPASMRKSLVWLGLTFLVPGLICGALFTWFLEAPESVPALIHEDPENLLVLSMFSLVGLAILAMTLFGSPE